MRKFAYPVHIIASHTDHQGRNWPPHVATHGVHYGKGFEEARCFSEYGVTLLGRLCVTIPAAYEKAMDRHANVINRWIIGHKINPPTVFCGGSTLDVAYQATSLLRGNHLAQAAGWRGASALSKC